jgi:hypothetical protein
MVDWNRKFRSEYDAARDALGDAGSFAEAFQPLAARLAVLMGFDGFDVAREQALTQLRLGLSDGDDGEDALLLRAAGVDSRSGACELAPDARRRAAALKLLRHVYLQSRAGNRRVWIVALPDEFTRWPSQQLADDGGGAGRIRQLLRSRREHFSAEQRRALGTGWPGASARASPWRSRPRAPAPTRTGAWTHASACDAGSPRTACPRRAWTRWSPRCSAASRTSSPR